MRTASTSTRCGRSVTLQGNSLQDYLQRRIREDTIACAQSLFIFDEVDKMPDGVLDAIAPYLDWHEHLDGVDYRRAVFLLLSNTGGEDINAHALQVHASGARRESITLGDLVRRVRKAAYNEPGGLHYGRLLEHNLIDHVVPFLPLTRAEVRLCAADYMTRRRRSGQGVDVASSAEVEQHQQWRVADTLIYFDDAQQAFSTSGCKMVPNQAELLLQQIEHERGQQQRSSSGGAPPGRSEEL